MYTTTLRIKPNDKKKKENAEKALRSLCEQMAAKGFTAETEKALERLRSKGYNV